jgi:hypothetical protein
MNIDLKIILRRHLLQYAKSTTTRLMSIVSNCIVINIQCLGNQTGRVMPLEAFEEVEREAKKEKKSKRAAN